MQIILVKTSVFTRRIRGRVVLVYATLATTVIVLLLLLWMLRLSWIVTVSQIQQQQEQEENRSTATIRATIRNHNNKSNNRQQLPPRFLPLYKNNINKGNNSNDSKQKSKIYISSSSNNKNKNIIRNGANTTTTTSMLAIRQQTTLDNNSLAIPPRLQQVSSLPSHVDAHVAAAVVVPPVLLPFTNDLHDGQPPICSTRFGLGEEGFDGYLGLEKIRIFDNNHNNNFSSATTAVPQRGVGPAIATATTANPVLLLPRILCIVYTHSNRHDTMLRTIVETYASRCDGFIAASNQTNPKLGAVHVPHEDGSDESYGHMWNKVRSIWKYVYDNLANDYDYFHLNGDDTYVIVENLRSYVSTLWSSSSSSETTSQDSFQYLGSIMADYKPRRTYCGGGGGYTLNRYTLQFLVRDILPKCGVNFTSSQEDFLIGICFLRHNRSLSCRDTRDDIENATRYHQSTAEWQVQWNGGKANVMRNDILRQRYQFSYKSRLEGISRNSISFHLKHTNVYFMERLMRRYHAILYHDEVCGTSTT